MFYKDLTNISKPAKMGREEQKECIERAKNGDQKSIDILVNNHLKLVIKIAQKFNVGKIELEDLTQEGVTGILEAIDRFDISKDIRFSTYVSYWILNKIGEFCRRNASMIRVPGYLINDTKKIIKFKNNYYKKNRKWPDSSEISRTLKFTPQKLDRARELFGEVYSLNQKIDERNDSLSDYLAEKEIDSYNSYVNVFNVLSETERELLELNSGLWNGGIKISYKNLAAKYNMSYRDVKTCIERSKRRIRKELRKVKRNG